MSTTTNDFKHLVARAQAAQEAGNVKLARKLIAQAQELRKKIPATATTKKTSTAPVVKKPAVAKTQPSKSGISWPRTVSMARSVAGGDESGLDEAPGESVDSFAEMSAMPAKLRRELGEPIANLLDERAADFVKNFAKAIEEKVKEEFDLGDEENPTAFRRMMEKQVGLLGVKAVEAKIKEWRGAVAKALVNAIDEAAKVLDPEPEEPEQPEGQAEFGGDDEGDDEGAGLGESSEADADESGDDEDGEGEEADADSDEGDGDEATVDDEGDSEDEDEEEPEPKAKGKSKASVSSPPQKPTGIGPQLAASVQQASLGFTLVDTSPTHVMFKSGKGVEVVASFSLMADTAKLKSLVIGGRALPAPALGTFHDDVAMEAATSDEYVVQCLQRAQAIANGRLRA